MSKTIEIVNVGPIERLEIPIPEDGGVVVLSGRNGLGKSTALSAASSLMDGETSLSIRDGQEKGSVAGLGVEIALKKRAARAGTLEVQRIAGEDPGLLVDPGVKDPAAADKVRIRALCRLAKVQPSRALFARLEGIAGVSLPITLADDVPESAAKTKRAIELKARDVEEEATKAAGRVEGFVRSAAAVDLSAPSDERTLSQAVEKAVRELAAKEGEAQATDRAMRDAEEARKALEGARARYTGPGAGEALLALKAAERAEQEAQAALTKAREARIAAEGTYKGAADFVSACNLWEETVAKAEGSFGVTDQELRELRATVDVARIAQNKGVLVRQAIEQKKQADELAATMQEKRTLADKLRQAAAACDAIVSDAIAQVAPRGLRVDGGRLIVTHARGDIPYEELSHGERWTVALDVAIDAVGEGGLLSIAQEAWEGLDPANRSLIAEHARRRKAVILTAEATLDPLKAEVLGG